MNIKYLINENGDPFKSSEIEKIIKQLDCLNDNERVKYRDQNAVAIAKHNASKILIVSGPGTGKSYLFLDRINHWCQNDSGAKVFVTTFVRKLVKDLQNDIDIDVKLTDEQKGKISVYTLHKFARSIVEKNHGTSEWPFRPHFRIIGQFWKDVVWGDVLSYYPEIDRKTYVWKKFEQQMHNDTFEKTDDWQKLKETFFKLCRFFNAAGFADLILRAKTSLTEDASLNNDNYFIIDEYQDFNLAEEALITQLVESPKGLLIVGDDEQVLYEKLKSGKATLIRRLYEDKNYANAMLPFCSRSTCHITKSVGYFIQQNRDANCIEKIYLPIKANDDSPKVQVIACATAPTAVDYIEKFIADNKDAIDERKEQLTQGKETDAFLLILTPAKEINFYRYKNSNEKLKQLVSEYQNESRSFSEDYYKILSFYSLAGNPQNNFTYRKVLFYEKYSEAVIHNLVDTAIQNEKDLCEIESEDIKDILTKCNNIKDIIDSGNSIDEKIDNISAYISIKDKGQLKKDIERESINQEEIGKIEHEKEEEAELNELETKRICAVELMTIIGSKGLSADNVIIIGFDDVNMSWVTKNAFYVAMTRARKSLHILTALKSGGSKQSHRFLNHLPEIHLEFYKYKKSDHSKTFLANKIGFLKYLKSLNNRSVKK